MCDRYVFFSYLPKFAKATSAWLDCDYDFDFGQGNEDESWWLKEGIRTWKQTMADQIKQSTPNATHIVLLSGGLDSRAVLGGLLENLRKSQIVTATYGMPGAWDFEIGQSVAHKFGVRNELFNLSNVKWDLDQLVKVAASLENPVDVQQCYLRYKINEYFGTDCVYWSGFLGDTLAGCDLPKVQNTDKKKAIITYINLYPTKNFENGSYKDELIEKIYAECPWERLNQKKYGLDQQMDIFIRQRFCNQNIVVLNGYDFKTPFLNRKWLNYISCVPYRWLLGKYLYKKILVWGYRDLFSLPVTGNYGMPLSATKTRVFLNRAMVRAKADLTYIFNKNTIHPRTNYLYFTETLRQKGDFQELVFSNLQGLIKRGLYLEADISRWWKNHLTRKQDNTTLLMNLSSLNILLMANNF